MGLLQKKLVDFPFEAFLKIFFVSPSTVFKDLFRREEIEKEAVSHRNGFRAEYSGRNLAEYSAETVSVKIMGFGDDRNIR